jgi:hypothetical protein
MTEDYDDDDRVGYGKPPKGTRFRPGQSGNPRGRSRAVDFKDWENPIQKYMLEPITVTIKGKKEKVPVVDDTPVAPVMAPAPVISNEAEFKNSSQGLGYSVIVDAIAARLGVVSPDSYEIIYGIYKTTAFEWEIMKFTKSFTQRALWIRDILLDMKRIADYSEADYWPLYGEHCFSYFRACEYFDVCNMSDSVLLDDQPKLIAEEEGKYEFKFTLAELITAQLEKSEKQKEAEQKEEADEA